MLCNPWNTNMITLVPLSLTSPKLWLHLQCIHAHVAVTPGLANYQITANFLAHRPAWGNSSSSCIKLVQVYIMKPAYTILCSNIMKYHVFEVEPHFFIFFHPNCLVNTPYLTDPNKFAWRLFKQIQISRRHAWPQLSWILSGMMNSIDVWGETHMGLARWVW